MNPFEFISKDTNVIKIFKIIFEHLPFYISTRCSPTFDWFANKNNYCAFDIFQKVVVLLGALYGRSKFVMIKCKTVCHNYLCTKKFILVTGF